MHDVDTTPLAAITGTPWTVTPANGDAPAYAWTVFPADDPGHGRDLVAVIRHEPGVWDDHHRQAAEDDGREYVPGEWPFTLYLTTTTPGGTPADEWEAWSHADDPADLARDARWIGDPSSR